MIVATLRIALCASVWVQDPEVPADEVTLRVTPSAHTVGFAEDFTLTVELSWDRALEPEPWDDAVLAPLDVRAPEVTRAERDGRVVETRRYVARLLETGDVVVPAPFVRARPVAGDGAPAIAFADDLEFTVASTLPDGDDGVAELPLDVLDAPDTGRPWWWAAAVALVLGALSSWFVVRRNARRAAVAGPAPAPADVALARLDALRASPPADARALHVHVARAVIDYVAARCALPLGGRTTPEILRADLDDAVAAPVRAVLERCDAVKFACAPASADECAALVDAAAALVRATARPAEESA